MNDADDEPTRDEYLTTAQLALLAEIAGPQAATARRLTCDVARAIEAINKPREGSDDDADEG